MKLLISHETTYGYQPPTRNLVQSLRLTPSIFEGQKTLDWQVEVTGGTRGPGFRDGAGDWIEGWTVRGPVDQVVVSVRGHVETRDTAGVLRGHRETVHPLTYLRDTAMTRADKGLKNLAASVEETDDELELSHLLSAAVSDAIAYKPGTTAAHTSAAEALALGEGVCQDHAHALIAIARLRGLPARYVSGYLHATVDGTAHDAAHAWAEINVSGLGWVGFDAANSCCPDERHVRLSSGFDAVDAAPIRGVALGEGAERLDVAVHVQEVAQ